MIQENKIEDIIAREGVYVSTISGRSMNPMLVNRRDTVAISPVSGRLKKYDVALYKVGGKYVLHRVVKVLPDSYIMCGDNCISLEYGITDADIIGKLCEVWRGDEKLDLNSLSYRWYCRTKVASFHPRRIYRQARARAAGVIKKILKK